LDSSATDPVEVVGLLIEAMGGQQIDERDCFGCTPLHYAAYHGATVSCLLLLQVSQLFKGQKSKDPRQLSGIFSRI